MAVALGGDDYLVGLAAHLKACGAQGKRLPQVVSRDCAVTCGGSEDCARVGNGQHIEPFPEVVTQFYTLKGGFKGGFQLVGRKALVLAEFRRCQVGTAVNLHKVVHGSSPCVFGTFGKA